MDQDILSWLMAHYGQEHFRPGLERMGLSLSSLLPQLAKTRVITIAGTNGKGETTLWLSEQLKNHRHCVWTSPHIESITERFRSEEGEIELTELTSLIYECHAEVQKNNYQLSFYEFLFFVFCSWTHKRAPEFLLLEVGLGGRLDAVNVFDAEVVLLPSLSRDHQEFLGNRYDLILQEKLGLLRPGKTLISFLDLNYLRDRARAKVSHVGGFFWDLEQEKFFRPSEFSNRNQLLAYAAFLFLQGQHDLTPKVLEKLHKFEPRKDFLAYRGQVFGEQGNWLLFGSHNTDGVRKLIQFLHSGTYTFSRPPFDGVLVAFSKRDQRDLVTMLRMLKQANLGPVTVTVFDHPKAASKELMEGLAVHEGLDFVQDSVAYIQDKSDKRLLVTGSYYFLGEFQSLKRSR